jgi:TnpA family transposase
LDVERRVVNDMVSRTPPELRETLLGLLDVELNSVVSNFNKLKESAGRASRNHLDGMVAHLTWLESFGTLDDIFKDILDAKIKYFGLIAKQYDAAALRDFSVDKRLVCILCLIRLMQIRTRDQLGEMFLKRIAIMEKAAKNTLLEVQMQQRSELAAMVVTLGGVLRILEAEDDDAEAGRLIREYVGSDEEIKRLQEGVAELQRQMNTDFLPHLWQHFISQRRILFRLIRLLDLESTCNDVALMAAIDIIKENENKTREWLSNDIDLSFVSERWRKFLRHEAPGGSGINRRHLEVCVFFHVALSLRSGDLAIARSEEFSDYRKELLDWENCLKLIPEHCARIGLPSTAKEFMEWLKQELIEEARKLDERFPESSGDVILGKDGRPIARKAEASPTSESAVRLREEIIRLMPDRHVLDCMENVEHWANYTRHFGPITGNDAKIKDAASRYLMTIFALGCNLGPTQAARHLKDSDVTAHMLSIVNRRHITIENLEAALRQLSNIYLELPLPRLWGDGKTVAADGTQHDFFDDNLLAGFHFRYRKTGAVAYRHVTNNWIAVFRHFIGPGIWEAVYVIEGLMKAGLNVEADTVQSDTQGQSASVFTYALLYGVKLMPRIRNWKDLRFFRPSSSVRYEHIDLLFSEVADWDLIEKGWQEVMQVAMSIVAGRISSARLLRKLSSYSRRNRLYFAAQAIGQVVRTIYLLKWIGSRDLREEVTANTNKIEAYNGFSKWSSFGGDVIPTNEPDEQQKRLRYIDLVAFTLILQTTVDMMRVLEKLSKRKEIRDEDVRSLSPYLTAHIMRFGRYKVRLSRSPEAWISNPVFRDAVQAAEKPRTAQREIPDDGSEGPDDGSEGEEP